MPDGRGVAVVMQDEGERYRRNLRTWAQSELPVFRLAEWDGEWRWESRSETAEGPGSPPIVTSLGVKHSPSAGWRGPSVVVTSHRPDDPQGLRQSVMANMAIQIVKDRVRDQDLEAKVFNRRHQRLRADLLSGRVPWAAATILVDGSTASCELVVVDAHWAAFCYLLEVHITIVGRHVPRPELEIVKIAEPPPAIDQPGAYGMISHPVWHVATDE